MLQKLRINGQLGKGNRKERRLKSNDNKRTTTKKKKKDDEEDQPKNDNNVEGIEKDQGKSMTIKLKKRTMTTMKLKK